MEGLFRSSFFNRVSIQKQALMNHRIFDHWYEPQNKLWKHSAAIYGVLYPCLCGIIRLTLQTYSDPMVPFRVFRLFTSFVFSLAHYQRVSLESGHHQIKGFFRRVIGQFNERIFFDRGEQVNVTA